MVSWLFVASDTDGEIIFAGSSMLTYRVFAYLPNVNHAYLGDSSEMDAGIMRMACETPAPVTGGLVLELKAKGHDEGNDTFEERLTIAKQLEVCRSAPEIDGDGTVFARRLSRCARVSHPCHQVFVS